MACSECIKFRLLLSVNDIKKIIFVHFVIEKIISLFRDDVFIWNPHSNRTVEHFCH